LHPLPLIIGPWSRASTTSPFAWLFTWRILYPKMSVTTAVVSFQPDASNSSLPNIKGGIIFRQQNESTPIEIFVDITGLKPNETHGWHIHEAPVPSGPVNCTDTGPHFNPLRTPHGAPTNNASARHYGDLGNFKTDAEGRVRFNTTDSLVSLFGKYPVSGLAVVIHAKADDLGLVNNTGSIMHGNAGARRACGNILLGQVLGKDGNPIASNNTVMPNTATPFDDTPSSSAIAISSGIFSILTFLFL
jgi:Cu-Zn family superoxide dismutase